MQIFNMKMTGYMSRWDRVGRLFVLFTLLAGVLMTTPMAAAEDTTSDTCLNHTGSEADCKDCCDCLDGAEDRKTCRDACIAQSSTQEGFTLNTDLISVQAPSELGADYDYSEAVTLGSEQGCKAWCDESDNLACGDRKYCRDACNAAFANSDGSSSQPVQDDGGISITQAISDEAQMKTIAFSALAFVTGDLCSYTFFPPGKVSDFFGFQYMRDIAPNGFGHNTEFAGRISDSVLSILTDDQVRQLVDLANTQADQVDAFGYKRFVLIKVFRRLLDNDLPSGATGLDLEALMEFTADLYELDGEISYDRARILGSIITGLAEDQKTALTELQNSLNTLFQEAGQGGSIADEDWPAADPVDLSGIASEAGRVLVSTYATQLYSWYLGSVEGDTYFCPERHGTYFGSFYLKDIPPLTATQAVTIDANLTAEMGTGFLEALDDTQASLITDLLDIQENDLAAIVAIRQEISNKLRLFMEGSSPSKEEVLEAVRKYGEYEGEMMYFYATRFAEVGNSLSGQQTEAVLGLRLDYYALFPDYQADPTIYDCSGAWLFSEHLMQMPEIENTDFLFITDSMSDAGGTGNEPVLVVKVNGSQGPVSSSSEDEVVVTTSLDAGNLEGQTGDWWMVRYYTEMNQWHSYVYPTGWISGLYPALQGPLTSFSELPVFTGRLLDGTHLFYFGFDLNPDGNPNPDTLQLGSAGVTVTP